MATAYLLEHFANEQVKERFLPHVISTGEVELFEGATFLTERQGGSDVGSNETKAVKEEEHYLLYGEKYFASNAGQCGVAMVLARMEGAQGGTKGISLFAVPWRLEEGKLNGIQIRRLKDKLGVKAVPSGEVVFDGAKAYLVGEESKGIYYMMEALNLSRVCNAVASIGIMRRAYTEARNYALNRETFGNKLINFPMIRESLVELAVKQEVETSAMFELIELFDRVMRKKGPVSQKDIVLNRLLIALLKKETAEQAVHFSHEAIEMHGGNGYIEDFVTPRLLRDAQVLTVWEGTANILGLEVLRLIKKYQVHHIFIEEMKERIDRVVQNDLSLKEPVEVGIAKLEELCCYVEGCSSEIQTAHSKKIAKLMGMIFESVIALEVTENGDERENVKAEIYIQNTWNDFTWIDRENRMLKYFDLIVM
jgi:alkylation response protein AidB-like acyl-CoA dehydrogenase